MHVERPGRETGTCMEYIDSFLLLSEINLKKKSPLPYLHVIICPSPTLLFKLGLFVIVLFFFSFLGFWSSLHLVFVRSKYPGMHSFSLVFKAEITQGLVSLLFILQTCTFSSNSHQCLNTVTVYFVF